MSETNNHHGPPLTTLLRRTLATGLGTLHNRGELLMVELQEEKSRALSLLVRAGAIVFLGMMALMLLTATVIFLLAEEHRVYGAAGFGVLYLLGAVWAAMSIRSSLKHPAFSETLAQLKKDREWMQNLK